MVTCIFSAKTRHGVKQHPSLHIIWFVASIIILVGIFAPIIHSCPGHINESTRTGMYERVVISASMAYLNEYGRLPLQTNTIDHNYHTEHAQLHSVLTGSSNSVTQNPRKLIFLETDFECMNVEERMFIDAWGNPLNIFGDWDMDQSITVGTNTINASMAVWSCGKDGENNYGSGDDVNSWEQ